MLNTSQIRFYYFQGFQEQTIHKEWPWLWRKHYRIRTTDNDFIKLNRRNTSLYFKKLKRLCIHHAPANVYMSVLNWLFPERVSEKQRSKHAYPISGEYVVDIDANSVWRYHPSCNMHKKICLPCLRLAKDATIEVLEKIEENYSNINVVFSGHRGFHVHVWDFDLEDWTRYDVTNPVKSHEVARFLYTRHLKKGFGDFDRWHFLVSSDTMSIISFPYSLNAKSGHVCTFIGNRKDLEMKKTRDILRESEVLKFLYNTDFKPMSHHAHLEHHSKMR
jgi:hypothetical protein